MAPFASSCALPYSRLLPAAALIGGLAFAAPALAQYDSGRTPVPGYELQSHGGDAMGERRPPRAQFGVNEADRRRTVSPRKEERSPLAREGRKEERPALREAKDAKEPPARNAARSRSINPNVPVNNDRVVDQKISDEVVIEVAGGMSQAQVEELAKRHGLTRIVSQDFKMTNSTFFRWRIPDGRTVSAVIRQLEADPVVKSATPNHVYTLQQQKGGSAEMVQYVASKLRLPEAHQVAKGKDVLVAVVDSGIDASHPDLDGLVLKRFDPFEGDKVRAHVHGTGIAGAIAARGKVTGVAPGVRILAARAFGGPSGTQSESFKILQALEWSVQNGAQIINMSFAGPHDRNIERLLTEARRRGIILVAAVGNNGPKSAPMFPGSHQDVIAVTAVDAEDKLFAASNRGDYVSVAAPGVDVLLPAPRGSYQVTSGTSFAAAHVTGVIALMLQVQPNLDPDVARRFLVNNARDLGPRGPDTDFGAGAVDAYGVLEAILNAQKATAQTRSIR